jgi:hypothetical protein
MAETGDFVEIISTGKPRETKVIIAGEDQAKRVSDVRIEMNPGFTVVTVTMTGYDGLPFNVRGFLVSEEDMNAFQEWQRQQGKA